MMIRPRHLYERTSGSCGTQARLRRRRFRSGQDPRGTSDSLGQSRGSRQRKVRERTMPDVSGSCDAYSCEEWDPCLFASADHCSAATSFTYTSSCLRRLAERSKDAEGLKTGRGKAPRRAGTAGALNPILFQFFYGPTKVVP